MLIGSDDNWDFVTGEGADGPIAINTMDGPADLTGPPRIHHKYCHNPHLQVDDGVTNKLLDVTLKSMGSGIARHPNRISGKQSLTISQVQLR